MIKESAADTEILHLLMESPEQGIHTLQREYGGMILHIVRRILPDHPQDAEEIAADVLVAAWKQAEQLYQQQRSLAPWLIVTARNRAIDQWRKMTRRNCISLNEELEKAEELELTEGEEIIGMLVQALDEPDREIFLRRYYRQETTKEIGQALQMTPNSINVRLSRGREKLKQLYLKEMGKGIDGSERKQAQ